MLGLAALSLAVQAGLLGELVLLAGAVPAAMRMGAGSTEAGAGLVVEANAGDDGWNYRYASYRGRPLGWTEQRPPGCAPAKQDGGPPGPEPLVLPVGVRVRMVFASGDVIRTWAVARLGERSAIPGLLGELDVEPREAGLYPAVCGGGDGTRQGGPVLAVPRGEFERWLDARVPARSPQE